MRSTATPAEAELRAALERYADALRAEADQHALPIDVGLIASVLGIRVRRIAADGFAARLHANAEGRLLVDVDRTDPPVRQRFSIAHELMHTAFPGFARPGREPPLALARRPDGAVEERLCDWGSAALLMPRELVAARYQLADGLSAVESLARDAAVSLEAAASRLAGLPGPPAALIVLERLHRPGDGAALRRGGHVPRRLRVRYAKTRGLGAYVAPYAAADRGSVLYRALSGRRRRGRERLPGAPDGGLYDVEAQAYGSPRRGLVLAVARPAGDGFLHQPELLDRGPLLPQLAHRAVDPLA